MLLPVVREQIPDHPYRDLLPLLVHSRIYQPLAEFDLVECRYEQDKGYFGRQLETVRRTDLFTEFLDFSLPGAD